LLQRHTVTLTDTLTGYVKSLTCCTNIVVVSKLQQ